MTTENRSNFGQSDTTRLSDAERLISSDIREKHENGGLSFDVIKDHYYPRASKGAVYRAYKGEFPKGDEQRAAFGLLPIVEVHVCERCGQEPEYCGNCYTNKPKPEEPPKPRPPRNRRALPFDADKARNAARILARHAPSQEWIDEFVSELGRMASDG